MNTVRQARVSNDRVESWDNLVRPVLVEPYTSDPTARRPPAGEPAGRSRRIAGRGR